MASVRVLVELKATKKLGARPPDFAPEAPIELDFSALPDAGAAVKFDPSFAPLPMPPEDAEDLVDAFGFMAQPETFVARAEVDEGAIDELRKRSEVVEVFSDPVIAPFIVCPGDPAVGSDADVERLLCSNLLNSVGMDGTGVMVAIVDTGINVAHLVTRGKAPVLDAARSWRPATSVPTNPGEWAVDHGTMCAYDALITAPKCTLLDVAVLQSQLPGPTAMSGVLSDAQLAYRHLGQILSAPLAPGETRSLVVNNSWGMYHPSWDFPVGTRGNYSNNPAHPFNREVRRLERLGADILFAAGNCGRNCPASRCQGVTDDAIYGANGHPRVLCVAGVDVTKTRVGYSTIGPARLDPEKPDLAGYTHFVGSGVYASDSGTSAATPVVAGVVAALRTIRPSRPSTTASRPAAIRQLLRTTAEDLGAPGWDPEYGWGVVNGCALVERVPPPDMPVKLKDFCKRYPWFCHPFEKIDICKLFPQLCGPPPIPIPPKPIGRPEGTPDLAGLARALGADPQDPDPVALSYAVGWMHGQAASREEQNS